MPSLAAFRRSYSLRLITGFLAAAGLLTVIGLFAKAGWFQYGDEAIRDYIQKMEFPALTAAMLIITRLGSTYVLTFFGIIIVTAFAYLGWRRPIALLLLAMAGQIVLHLGFKLIFDIDRPQALLGYVIDDTHSFPSGHSLASMSFYGLVAFLVTARIASKTINQIIWMLAAVTIFLVGFSRVYFGVHHPSDVLAGFVAASVWVWAVASGDDKFVTGANPSHV